jgi:hypothetical protein
MTSRPVDRRLVTAVLLLAAGLRSWSVTFGLPYSYHADEVSLLRRTLGFGTGDLNPHAFHWPAFHLYLVFAVFGVAYLVARAFGIVASREEFGALWFSDPTLFFLLARGISAILGTATVGLVYLCGRRLGGPRAGLLGALCLALTYYHVRDSHLATLDVPTAFWVAATLVLALRLDESAGLRDWLLAGAAAGLAAATKYNGGIALVALLAAGLAGPGHRRLDRFSLAALVAAGVFLAANPYVLLDFPTFQRDFQFQRLHIAEGQWGLGGDGAFAYYVDKMLRVSLKDTSRSVFDPMVLLFVAGAVAATVAAPRRAAAIVLSVPGAYLLYIGGWGMAATRYLEPAFPGLAAAAGFALSRAPVAARLLGGAALSLSACTVIVGSMILSGLDTRTEAKLWIESHIPANAKIAIENYAPPLARSAENLARRIRGVANGELRHPTQSLERLTLYYRLRAENAPGIGYDIERLNDNLLDANSVEANRMPATNYDLERLRRLGVRYVVTSSFQSRRFQSDPGRRLYPRISRFYEDLDREARLVRRFCPTAWQPGPEIRIYEVSLPSGPSNPRSSNP